MYNIVIDFIKEILQKCNRISKEAPISLAGEGENSRDAGKRWSPLLMLEGHVLIVWA